MTSKREGQMRRLACVMVVALLATASLSAVAAAGPAVKSVSAALYAHGGGGLSAAVQFRASVASPASKATLFLSRNRKGDGTDARLTGSLQVPALKAGATFRAEGRVSVPSTVPAGNYFVLACPGTPTSADAPGCVAAAAKTHITDLAVTTRSLLEAAVSKGELTADQALTYRVFAVFGDTRIPAKYLGDDESVDDDSVMAEALERWPDLSAAARAAIEPFFTPPAARGSWANGGTARPADGESAASAAPHCNKDPLASSEWDHLDTGSGKVRIWWRKDADANASRKKAGALAKEIDTTIWPALSKIFSRQPLSDAKVECFKGGDGKLDIYFNRLNRVRALTVSYAPKCKATPAFILLPEDATPWELAHETAHAFQFAYPYRTKCADYIPFDEGAATWAAHKAYPRSDYEHIFSWEILLPWFSFATTDYHGWVFDLYLEEVFGSGLVTKIYDAFTRAAPLKALNATLPGGFDTTWPEFARYGWNQEPVVDSFKQWDRLAEVPGQPPKGHELKTIQLALGDLDERTLNLPLDLEPLSRTYARMHVVEGDKLKYLKFSNTIAGIPHAQVQAFVRLADGTWHTQDWSARGSVEFCFDNQAEKVSDIVLIYSNSDGLGNTRLKPATQPTLALRNVCDALPFYYRVVDWSFEERVSGSASGTYPCGDVSGSQDFVGDLPASTSGAPPAGKLDLYAGSLTGQVRFDLPAGSEHLVNNTRQGCKHKPGGIGYEPCSVTFPDFALPAAKGKGMDFFAMPGDEMVRVTWAVNTAPGIGSSNLTDAGCNVGFNAYAPYDIVYTYYPLAKFKGTEPFTMVNSGQLRFDKDGSGHTIDLNYSWSHTITLQRVGPDGNALE